MGLQVVGHTLMIKPEEIEKRTASGIYLAKDEKLYREATMRGQVVQLGPNAFVGFADNKPWCSVGDNIVYARHSGKFVVDPETEEEFYISNDEDVQVIVTSKKEKE